MSFVIGLFDVLDGKSQIEALFKNEDEYERFMSFYRESVELFKDREDAYGDPRGIEQGWVGKDGRP